MRRLLALSVVALLALAAGASADAGEKAVLSGTTVSGKPFDIAQDRGEVVIVNFWATWCTPCRAEMPALDSYYQAHKARGLRLIGVSEDRSENAAAVRAALAGVHYPSATLATLDANSFGHPHILPVTFVVGRGGTVRVVFPAAEAPLTTAKLEAAVTPLLGADSPQ